MAGQLSIISGTQASAAAGRRIALEIHLTG